MAVFIANFQSPKKLEELEYFYDCYGHTNLDVLFEDAKTHKTESITRD